MNISPDDRLEKLLKAAQTTAQHVPTTAQQARARAGFLLEVNTVSLNGDMRHRAQTGALSDAVERKTGKRPMNRLYSKHARMAAAVLLGVIVGGGFWATPPLRSLAQEILDFFMPAASDVQPGSVFVGGESDAPDNYFEPSYLSLDEAVVRADFAMRLPTYMPQIMSLERVLLSEDAQRVEMIYRCAAPWRLMIVQANDDQTPPSLEVGASAVIEELPIRDVTGQYVRGMWLYAVDADSIDEQDGTVREVPATRVWSNESEWQWLVWREDGINFTITTAGGIMEGHTQSPCALTKEEYIAIAEGLQPASAAGS